MRKKIILSFVIILILTSNVYANQGWGMSVMKCSEVLEKKGPKYWDEWILMTSQGLLSGLNVWHLRKFGHTKNLGRYDGNFLIAYIYSECKRNKDVIMGEIVQQYLFSLPKN